MIRFNAYILSLLYIILIVITILTYLAQTNETQTAVIIPLQYSIVKRQREVLNRFVATKDPELLTEYLRLQSISIGELNWTELVQHPLLEGVQMPASKLINVISANSKETDIYKEMLAIADTILWMDTLIINWVQGKVDRDGTIKDQFLSMREKKIIPFQQQLSDPNKLKQLYNDTIQTIHGDAYTGLHDEFDRLQSLLTYEVYKRKRRSVVTRMILLYTVLLLYIAYHVYVIWFSANSYTEYDFPPQVKQTREFDAETGHTSDTLIYETSPFQEKSANLSWTNEDEMSPMPNSRSEWRR